MRCARTSFTPRRELPRCDAHDPSDAGRGLAGRLPLGTRSYELTDKPYNFWSVQLRLIEAVVVELRTLGRRDVVAVVSSANEASRELFRRAGFEEAISVTFFTRHLR
jgi:hypothetical protein